MIDALNVYRKVTRKIYDFSPEQEQNLPAIVWLYRGCTEKFLELVAGYCRRTLTEAEACFAPPFSFIGSLSAMRNARVGPFKTPAKDKHHAETIKELDDTTATLFQEAGPLADGKISRS